HFPFHHPSHLAHVLLPASALFVTRAFYEFYNPQKSDHPFYPPHFEKAQYANEVLTPVYHDRLSNYHKPPTSHTFHTLYIPPYTISLQLVDSATKISCNSMNSTRTTLTY